MANNVQRFREAQMMSKAELARKAGLSTLTIDRVESGRPCRLDTKRKILLALEGTATQTVAVTPYALAEVAPNTFEAQQALTDRRFYKMAASAVTVTVGEVTSTPAMPGKVYLRLTSAPAADAVLRVSFG